MFRKNSTSKLILFILLFYSISNICKPSLAQDFDEIDLYISGMHNFEYIENDYSFAPHLENALDASLYTLESKTQSIPNKRSVRILHYSTDSYLNFDQYKELMMAHFNNIGINIEIEEINGIEYLISEGYSNVQNLEGTRSLVKTAQTIQNGDIYVIALLTNNSDWNNWINLIANDISFQSTNIETKSSENQNQDYQSGYEDPNIINIYDEFTGERIISNKKVHISSNGIRNACYTTFRVVMNKYENTRDLTLNISVSSELVTDQEVNISLGSDKWFLLARNYFRIGDPIYMLYDGKRKVFKTGSYDITYEPDLTIGGSVRDYIHEDERDKILSSDRGNSKEESLEISLNESLYREIISSESVRIKFGEYIFTLNNNALQAGEKVFDIYRNYR